MVWPLVWSRFLRIESLAEGASGGRFGPMVDWKAGAPLWRVDQGVRRAFRFWVSWSTRVGLLVAVFLVSVAGVVWS